MEIQPPADLFARPSASTSPSSPVNPAELVAKLQPGQTLLAKVESLLANNEVVLRIGNQSIRANTPIPLNTGQSVPLLVEESATGNILRITQQASEAEVLSNAWRTVLPKQQPIADVIKVLVQTLITNKNEGLIKANPTPANTTVNNLNSSIQTLVSNLPSVKTLSQASGLQQAIKNSGINLESHLRQALITNTPPNTSTDIKANLLRVAESALQLQSKLDPNTVRTALAASQANSGTVKTNATDTYTALLNAATKQPASSEQSNTHRPLLPPLPAATTSPTNVESSITQRLISSLPPLLQRLLPIPVVTNSSQTSPTPSAQQAPAVPQQVFSTMIVELLNQVESGLARVQQHQLSSLAGDDIIRHFLGLELPVFNGKGFDNIGVRIEWEGQTNDELKEQHQWRVVLNFDFDGLGKIQAIIHAGENEIHTDFKSENNVAQKLFQENQKILETGLRKHGLTPGKVTFTTGEIDTPSTNSQHENIVKTEA